MTGYREKDVMRNTWNARAKDLEFIGIRKSNKLIYFSCCTWGSRYLSVCKNREVCISLKAVNCFRKKVPS